MSNYNQKQTKSSETQLPPQQDQHLPPPYPYYYSKPDENKINLLDLWKGFVKYRNIIILTTVVSTTIAFSIALVTTPIYRAETLLAPILKEGGSRFGALAGQFGGIASLAGIDLGGRNGGTEEVIAKLKSRQFTNKFIKEENLLPILYQNKWDIEGKQWIDTEKQPTLWSAYGLFDSIRKIVVDNKSGLVTLSIEWRDPALAADWANKLVQRINEKLRLETIANAERSIKYLKGELENTSIIEIKQSIYNLIEAQTKNKMMANTQKNIAFHVLDKAVTPENKIKPKMVPFVILGAISGLMLGLFIAFIHNAIQNWQDEEKQREGKI